MFIIGTTGRGGLRVTTIAAVETAEQLYYYLLIYRSNVIERIRSQNYSWTQSTLERLLPQTIEECLEDSANRNFFPDVYSLIQNTAPTNSNIRTTTKWNNRELLQLFREENLNLRVTNNNFHVPHGILV